MLNFGASKPRVKGGPPWIRTWFTLPGTETDTDAIGLQTHFVGVGIGVEQCEHVFPATQFEIYRKPTKLREGNVFSRMCVSVHRRGPMSPLSMIHWASQYRDSPPPHTHKTWDLAIQHPSPVSSPTRYIW